MKKFLALLFATGLAIMVPTSMAADSSEVTSLTDGTGTPSGPVIYVIHNTTPDGKMIMADELRVLAGKTCDTLVQTSDVFSNLIDIPVRSKNSLLTSEDLIKIFGAAQGCIKVDVIYDGNKEVTTGNIALTWDSDKKAYVAASPAISNTNFQ